jgi:hypothetical protein
VHTPASLAPKQQKSAVFATQGKLRFAQALVTHDPWLAPAVVVQMVFAKSAVHCWSVAQLLQKLLTQRRPPSHPAPAWQLPATHDPALQMKEPPSVA